MRKLLLSFISVCAGWGANAQTAVVATFDTLYLSKQDTFYVNYNNPMTDVGFNDGLAHFPCYYDTSWGGLWSSGFVYSNMTDSVTSGYENMYSAKTAKGYNNSDNYAVFWQGYNMNSNKIKFHGAQSFRPQGFYATNSTYAYNSMRDGDFASRKFGDTTGTNSGLPQGNYPDWFKLTVFGYSNGAINDSVEFYLADFRFSDDTQDYIVKDWQWVDLQSLTSADSLDFQLTSSDNNPMYGMNTPAYFCMDDFTVSGLFVGINDVPQNIVAKVYPNPATDKVFVELYDTNITAVSLFDMSGRILGVFKTGDSVLSVPVSHLAKGIYLLQVDNGNQKQSVRFIKQ